MNCLQDEELSLLFRASVSFMPYSWSIPRRNPFHKISDAGMRTRFPVIATVYTGLEHVKSVEDRRSNPLMWGGSFEMRMPVQVPSSPSNLA
ncbi:hypothetical protein AVEN_86832-1 [Araneus ventricosus]|uniref:Uncharacterized protein n=1 Tax=Araneus ventricosus TaxID=182803 RepID=A0A4Y2D1G2_ARAVE|nr:hypothetical protein AVEN_86832-1 [Araneus ventricosus]